MALVKFLSVTAYLVLLLGAVNASPRSRVARQAAPGACTDKWFQDAATAISQTKTGLTITAPRVRKVAAGGAFGTGNGDDPSNGQFGSATDLPALCGVRFHVKDGTANYDFGMLFPDTFNGAMFTVGGESWGGGINWSGMKTGAKHGFATVSTNNGHNSTFDNTRWARGNEDAKQDWGFRAMDGAVVYGKALVTRFYAKSFKSYYSGCSTGGRQGLRQVMERADSFDGLLIGAPAWDTVDISPWTAHLSKVLLDNGGAWTEPEIRALSTQFITQCDAQTTGDNAPDYILSDPAGCLQKFDRTKVYCSSGANPCIEDARAKAILAAFLDPYTVPSSVSTPELVSTGYDPGAEYSWYTWFGVPSILTGYNGNYMRDFLNKGDSWNVQSYSDDIVRQSRQDGAGKATVRPFDMTQFKAKKGKIILYHGTADGILPRGMTEKWYNDVKTANGGNADSFLRYFEVPGMTHCLGGLVPYAPWIFGGHNQFTSVGDGYQNPAFPGEPTPEVDALTALIAWVGDDSKGPTSFTVASEKTDPDKGNKRWTRKICKYPAKPRYTGTLIEDKDSWSCV
jgi:feruloyl esterase